MSGPLSNGKPNHYSGHFSDNGATRRTEFVTPARPKWPLQKLAGGSARPSPTARRAGIRAFLASFACTAHEPICRRFAVLITEWDCEAGTDL
jgi:hypothetical protein